VNPTSSWRFSPKVIAVIVKPVSVDCPAENESTKCRVLAMLLQLAATTIIIFIHIHTYSYYFILFSRLTLRLDEFWLNTSNLFWSAAA
jgi:hypothetical protein